MKGRRSGRAMLRCAAARARARRRKLGFREARAKAAAVRWGSKGFQGGSGALYRGGDRALACGPRRKERRGACGGRTPRESVRRGGDDPDRRAPPVGGLREGKAGTGWAGGKEKVTGRREGEFGLREKKKKGRGGTGWARREEEK